MKKCQILIIQQGNSANLASLLGSLNPGKLIIFLNGQDPYINKILEDNFQCMKDKGFSLAQLSFMEPVSSEEAIEFIKDHFLKWDAFYPSPFVYTSNGNALMEASDVST